MKERVEKLIDFKSILTFILTISLVIGFFKGMITADVFVPFVSMTFTFYFAKNKKEE
jgi:hypothetical protein